jgi:hypothetical protein
VDDSFDIDADGPGYLTLDVPECNVAAVSKKCTSECPEDLIENTHCGRGRGYSKLGLLFVVRQFETDQAFREERLWLIKG